MHYNLDARDIAVNKKCLTTLSKNFYWVGEAENNHHISLFIKYLKNKNKVGDCVREIRKE